MNLLVYNIGCLATPIGKTARRGVQQGEILKKYDCYIKIENGIITEIGDNNNLPNCDNALNAEGRLVTPGLIDCHTHLVFGGWRQHEFPLKLKGAGYLEILEAGGGILSTVRSTRESSFEDLYLKTKLLLKESASFGVTTIEAKSGYGLDLETEIKCLEVLKKLNQDNDTIDVVSTFMGAHAMPPEFKDNRDGYIKLLCDTVIPEVKNQSLAEFCDVFCEKGAFDLAESEQILKTAKNCGFCLKIHAEEITNMGGAKLAADLGCISAEHLIKINDEGIRALANSNTVAVCLPCTSFYLNEDFAPAKKIIEVGGAVAVSTDFNPGSSPNLNLQLAMSTACYKYRLTPEQVLTAVTLNAAAAINRADTIGSVEIGKRGDMVLWNTNDLNYVMYRYGSNLAEKVIKTGKVI